MAKKKAKKWVQAAHIQKGGLHESLGKKAGEPITAADIVRAKKRGGKAAKQAILAQTFKKMSHRRAGKK